MVIEFEYSARDFKHGVTVASQFKILNILVIAVAAISLLSLFAAPMLMTEGGGIGAVWDWIGPIWIVTLFLLIYRFGYPILAANRAFKVPSLRGYRQIEFTDAGLATRSETANSMEKWTSFLNFTENKHVFVLFPSKHVFIVIPKRAMSTDQEDKIRNVLQANLSAR